jgi:GNAT acetyltransferase-like protein
LGLPEDALSAAEEYAKIAGQMDGARPNGWLARRSRWLYPIRSRRISTVSRCLNSAGQYATPARAAVTTELGRAALAWVIEHQLDLAVVAFTEVHNHASRAVMRRLGMRPAGMIRRVGLIEGQVGIHPDAPFALYRL